MGEPQNETKEAEDVTEQISYSDMVKSVSFSETLRGVGAVTNKFDYWRDMWTPVTQEVYAKGGHYLLQELRDGKWVDVRPLSLEEALTFKMTKTQALLHVYPEKE